MKFYYAPMEGITGCLYRQAHQDFFPGVDRYYTPFLAPKTTGLLSNKERRDIEPEENKGIPLIPQLLSNHAEAFIHTARELHEMGYEEINLNLGCPSGTVVSKGKGSGFLAFPEALDRFLDTIYSALDFPVSIKTRIGRDSPEEAEKLLSIFNCYPIAELIVHPRIQTDFYKNKPNLAVFSQWLAESRNPICYNGDIFTVADFKRLSAEYPQLKAVMLGRGMVTNPALIREITGGAPLDKETLRAFSDRLLHDYALRFSGERSVLFKAKEMWFYQSMLFPDSARYLHRIQKAGTLSECLSVVAALLREREIQPGAGYLPAHGGKMC